MSRPRIRPRSVFSALVLAVGVLLAVAVPGGHLQAAPAGSVSGTVTDSSGNPLQDICVLVTPEHNTGLTDASGGYSVGGLSAGDHLVEFFDCASPATHVTQWYLGQPDEGSAGAVFVNDGVDTSLAIVKMEPGVVISGRVTDTGGNPVEGILAQAEAPATGRNGPAWTEPDGTYRTNPLPAGDYVVSFSDPATNPSWATQYWSGRHSWQNADTLTLDAAGGSEVSGVDAVMGQAAAVSGTVTDSGGGPLGNICVNAHEDGSVAWIGGAQTAGDGTYRIVGLPAVGVLVSFSDCGGGTYVEQWYDGAPDSGGATSLALSGGFETIKVNAQMSSGYVVAGRVTDSGASPIPDIDLYLEPEGGGGAPGWARTDGNGDYVSSPLGIGRYRVHFQDRSATPVWASEYWNDQIAWDDADLVDITGDQQVVGGVDAVLSAAATVTGRVVNVGGDPLEGICVGAIEPGRDGSPVGWAQTDAGGNYTMAGLPAVDVSVAFLDCNELGPYSMQWYDGVADPNQAIVLSLVPTQTVTGVDAELTLSALIRGKVTDPGGNPISGVCVQATTLTSVGGMGLTDDNGVYGIVLGAAGDYRVQFVDCDDPSEFGGMWWGGGLDPTTATFIPMAPGDAVLNVDATLAPAATGHLRGQVTNVRGEPMKDVCAVVFLPDRYVLFAPTDADGVYDVPALPSGNWTVGFVGCAAAEGDGPASVTDPATGITYEGIWHDGALVVLDGDGAPDPIAQGAKLVTVAPGSSVEVGMCFGCAALEVTEVAQDGGSVTAAFEAPGLAVQGSGVSPAASDLSYALTCDSDAGVTASGQRVSSPVSVSGLAPGSSNQCSVVATVDGVVVARSAAFSVVVAGNGENGGGGSGTSGEPSGSSPSPGQPDSGTPAGASSGPGSAPANSAQPLAVTGSETGSAAVVAALSLVLGLLVLGVARMTSRPSVRPAGAGPTAQPTPGRRTP